MSLLNNIGGLISQFTRADSDQAGAAAADHIGGMDVGGLASHLTQSTQNLDSGQLGQLVQSILGALSNHGQAASSVADAGVATADAQAGDSNAVADLIAHAQQNPAALKDAAIDFIQNNPQAVEQFAPNVLKGIISKFAS